MIPYPGTVKGRAHCAPPQGWYTCTRMKHEHICLPAGTASDSVRDIKSRFGLVVIISTLLSTALASLYQLLTNSPKLAGMGYLGMFIPAMYILAYVSFEAAKRCMDATVMMVTRRMLLAGLGLYVFPVTFIALYQNGASLTFGMRFLLDVSIVFIPLVAVATLLTVLIGWGMGCKAHMDKKRSMDATQTTAGM